MRKDKKLYYVEGKTMNGANSLDHLLNKGSQQADIIVVYVIGTNDARYHSSVLRQSFERNISLNEVMLLKGSRLIKIKRGNVTKKDL